MTDIAAPADRAAHHCFTLACNNGWANRRLLGACRALPAGAFAAPRPSVFGSLRATANHMGAYPDLHLTEPRSSAPLRP